MEKLFKVMHIYIVEGVELAVYQLKKVASQWYSDWEEARGEGAEPSV